MLWTDLGGEPRHGELYLEVRFYGAFMPEMDVADERNEARGGTPCIQVRRELEEKRRDMFEGGMQDGDRGDEGGYRPFDCPESDMKQAEE